MSVAVDTVGRPPQEPAAPVTGRRGWGVRAIGLLAAIVVLLAAMLASLALGARSIPPHEVWHALWHDATTVPERLVREGRVPRTLLGLLVGAALGVAGALMQALTRNPLADPGLLGVNAGAATAVVIAMATLGLTTPSEYVWFAFLGAAVVSLVVYALGAGGGSGASPVRLALAGVAVTAALTAFIAAMVLLKPQVFEQFRYWEVGALSGRDVSLVRQMAWFIVPGLVLAVLLTRSLNVLALGDDTGRALGARPGRIRALSLLAITALSGAATAAAGPIAFVGLTVPHVARAITGPDQRWIVPYSAVLGAALLLTADVIGRLIDPPGEVQVAVVTAFIGAPFFIALVSRRRIAQL
ncbi:FecCD family ABC transporter permease [Patulibacter minatonensis]|uniref:FecCD family ABC transporter permease n=1 Tax=Patulibacter minatonensis TaxID=298163 RepID=UPI000479C366|nr:iron chelate uptake ABC transporter family permease subunit [Patulibacter minatonensis]